MVGHEVRERFLTSSAIVVAAGVDLDGASLRSTVGDLVAGARAAGCAAVTVVAAPPLARLLDADAPTVEASGCDAAAVLRAVAGAVGAADRVVVARADVVTHPWALRQLLTEPGGPAALTVDDRAGGAAARVEDGALASAGSACHHVTGPTAALPGAVAADAAAIAAAVDVATRFPAIAGDPRADAVDLLTVALVRAGRRVAAVAGDPSVARRARGADDAAAAIAAAHAVDERAVRTAAVVKPVDSAFTTYLVNPYSRHLARWAAERGVTPNQVTVASLLVGVVAAVAFGIGDRAGLVAGALLLQVSFALDCVDGELARYARIFSPLGGWLDASFDRLKEYAVYAGLAIGGARSGDDVWLLAACALALQVVRHAVDFGFATRHADRRPAPPLPFDRPSDEPRARVPSTTGVARLSAATSRARALMYAKRAVILPIGERWALISLCAAVAGPRVAFVALLSWGGLAAAYMLTGRVLRSVPDA